MWVVAICSLAPFHFTFSSLSISETVANWSLWIQAFASLLTASLLAVTQCAGIQCSITVLLMDCFFSFCIVLVRSSGSFCIV